MASAFTHTAAADLGRDSTQAPLDTLVISELLSCLVLSWSDQRALMLQAVAEDESWHAKVCDDVQEFLKSVFQLDVPLTIVDLPRRESAIYERMRGLATQTCGMKRSLLVVCGANNDQDEEQWARQLGVWCYLPGVKDANGLRLIFAEARKALARQSTAYVEASSYR